MKLAGHVDHLRELIEAAFDKQFARLGFGKTKQMDATQVEKLPEEVQAKRERFVVMLDNHIGETGCYESAREKLLDELTFTLFNRLAAIKVMEAASLFPPILTKQSEHGDRSFGHKAWLEMNPHMRDEELEGIRDYLKAAFDELGQTLPLYSKAYPYALLPDAVSLNDIIDAFNAVDTDAQANDSSEETIWQSDDVLGWMYESYNNKKKQAHKDSKDKTEYNKVSLQSQVYTPRWVVQFLVENSLGKMYLEMYPQSEIKKRYKIANAPATQTRTPKPLHEVRTIDPACGSGNFLLYAFDFYYELYQDQIENYGADYDEKDIPKLIIENNLHGIDLDDRAIQLAQLGLFIKAKKKRRTVGELNFRVVSSDFYLPEYNEVRHIFEQDTGVERNQQELIEKIWNDLQYAYKFGSLVHIDEQLNKQLHAIEERAKDDLFAKAELTEHQDFAANFFSNLTQAVEQYARTGSNTFLTSKTRDAIRFLELLTTEYDVATANPPYTDSADFGPDLKQFIEDNYKKPYKFNINLYATFMKRCFEITNHEGKLALIHPDTFMFIKKFEGMRDFILGNTKIGLFAHYPQTGGVFGIGIVYPAFYILDKGCSSYEKSTFIDVSNINEGRKNEIAEFSQRLDDAVSRKENSKNYEVDQSLFKIISSSPFIYWISNQLRDKFKSKSFNDYFKLATGLMTGDNLKHLRYYWEVDPLQISKDYKLDKKPWVPYQKGGDYKKWFGNNWLVVNYDGGGARLATTDNKAFYFKEGITYSATAARVAFRSLPENQIFDKKGSCIFSLPESNKWDLHYTLAVLNSKLTSYIVSCLNSTPETQVGDIKRIPFVEVSESDEACISTLARTNISISRHLNSFVFYEKEFSKDRLFKFLSERKLKVALFEYLSYEINLQTIAFVNEAIIDKKIYEIYKLDDFDRDLVISKKGEAIGSYPICSGARDAYLRSFKESDYSSNTTSDFINELPVYEFSIDEVGAITKGFSSLYQNNNDLELFCVRNKVNPINIWYWFKESKSAPQYRINSIAFGFLVDVVRNILIKDDDGIVPLCSNSGEKLLSERVETHFLDLGFSSSQYSELQVVLGGSIPKFLHGQFFKELSETLNLFQHLPKTPFIWHLTSGPEQGFDCYIIIYKWSRDNLLRLRSVYIENRERALQNRQSDIAGNESAEAQNEKERIFKQLKEIDAFKKKIDELLAEGYNPILDDGVGKNIAPLQKKKMLAYDVLNAGQLKKYLNADW